MTEINNSENLAKCNEYANLPVSKDAALAVGAKHFFTGRKCKRGHLARRLTSSGTCMVCASERQAKLRADDPEWSADQNRRKYAARREAAKARAREYYQENREAMREAMRTWWRNNPDQVRAWREANRDSKRVIDRNRRAQKAGSIGQHTAADVKRIYAEQNGLCKVCDIDLEIAGQHVDHVVPLAAGGSNAADNIQLLCPTCNMRKGTKPFDLFLAEYMFGGF